MRQSMYRVLLLLMVVVGSVSLFFVNTPAVLADPAPCADLVITDMVITPSYVTQGEPTNVKITVKNQGTCESLTFTVQWKHNELAPTGPSFNVDRLGPGQSTVVNGSNGFPYTFQEAGNFNSVATVDSDRTVDETSEGNNIAILPITVYPNLPDLALASFTISPEEPTQGVPAQIEITVENRGPKDAGPFTVQWKHGQTAPTGPSQQFEGLAAWSSVTFAFQYAFPNAGNFTTVVNIDTDRTVTESNEDNNLGILATSVIAAAPDLVITGFEITPVDPAPGFPLLPVEGLNARIDIEVLNQGNAPSGPFVVQWKSATNAPTGPSEQVSGLGIGESTTVSFIYAFPNAGKFTTQANVDSNRDVKESNETNNLEILSIEVQRAVIDLVVTEFKVVPAPGVDHSIPEPGADPNPVQNRPTRVSITYKNQGNYPAGAFKVAWKPGPSIEADITTQVNGLKYGTSETWTFDYIYRTNGSYTTVATVDSTDMVREINERNNSESKNIVVEPELPDLEILDFYFIPSQPVSGLPVKIVIEIRNRGNTAAGPFDVQWFPGMVGDNTPQRSQVVNGLGVHAVTEVVFQHTYNIGLAASKSFNSIARVDAPISRVRELNEDNNEATLQGTVVRAEANLVINDIQIVSIQNESCNVSARSLALVEPQLDQNQDYFVCITIQNLGNSPVGPFVVSWNPDTLNLAVPSLNTLTQQVDLLGPGEERVVQFVFAYPVANNFRSIAKVDAFNVIRETNETDNERILNVVVNATGPDLVITELEVDAYYGGDFPGNQTVTGLVREPRFVTDRNTCIFNEDRVSAALSRAVPPPYDPDYTAFLYEDQVARVCIKVLNKGDRAAGPFVVDWNPDSLGLITPSPATITVHVPETGNEKLEAGESVMIEFFFVYVDPGTYRSVAKVDSHNHVAELNEDNNLALRNIEVIGDKPDLRVTGIKIVNLAPINEGPRSTDQVNCSASSVPTADEPQLTRGIRYGICVTIQNSGSVAADDFVLSWNPDANGVLVPSPGTLTAQVAGLDPFQSLTVPFEFTYEQEGGFHSIAQVDAFNVVEESNEANNKEILNVFVKPAIINLNISFDSVTSPVDRGSKITANIRVCETAGQYPTGAFNVQWKPAGDDTAFGPTQRVEGLLPGQCKVLTFEGSIFTADVYQSTAYVDTRDEIIETNENDNRATRTIDVQPRVTRITLDFENMRIIEAFEDGINGEGEWDQGFIVVDPNATGACDISLETGGFFVDFPDIVINQDGLRCAEGNKDELENGDNYDPNVSFTFNLEESFPIVLASLGIQDGSEVEFPDFTGVALQVWSVKDYLNVGTDTIPGQEGSCDGGHCFDLRYSITIVDAPAPFYYGTAGTRSEEDGLLPTPTVVLPESLARSIPPTTVLPEGLSWPEGWEVPSTPATNNRLFVPTIQQ